MWCRGCQQDVPAIASLEKGKYHCARCNGEVGRDTDLVGATLVNNVCDQGISLETVSSPPDHPRVEMDDWDAEQDLRELRRVLQATAAAAPRSVEPRDFQQHRFDPPSREELRAHFDARPTSAPATASTKPAVPNRPIPTAISWMASSLGLMGFVCGAVLVGWGMTTGRDDLWNLGLMLTLGGQCGLVVGLLFGLDRIWQTGRFTSTKLDEVDRRLDHLREDTNAMASTGVGRPQAFYSHLAGPASPQLLLADLQGQLDMLASRIERSA